MGTEETMIGAGRVTRTPDPIITNDVLYLLSYTGTFEPKKSLENSKHMISNCFPSQNNT